MKSLNEIAIFYGTDKVEPDHTYVSVYQSILKGKENDNLKILEIGIYQPQQHEQIRKMEENYPGRHFEHSMIIYPMLKFTESI
jgi:hypothetical protein